MALSQLLRLLSFASAGTLCFLFAIAVDTCRIPASGLVAENPLPVIFFHSKAGISACMNPVASISGNRNTADNPFCQEKSEELAIAPQDGTLATDRIFDNFKSQELKSVAFPVSNSALASAAGMGTCFGCPGKVPFKKSMVSRREDRGPPHQYC